MLGAEPDGSPPKFAEAHALSGMRALASTAAARRAMRAAASGCDLRSAGDKSGATDETDGVSEGVPSEGSAADNDADKDIGVPRAQSKSNTPSPGCATDAEKERCRVGWSPGRWRGTAADGP